MVDYFRFARREAGSMLKQKLSKTMRAAVDCQPGRPTLLGHSKRREAGDICHGSIMSLVTAKFSAFAIRCRTGRAGIRLVWSVGFSRSRDPTAY
jgi:hypothetical protein